MSIPQNYNFEYDVIKKVEYPELSELADKSTITTWYNIQLMFFLFFNVFLEEHILCALSLVHFVLHLTFPWFVLGWVG